MRQAVTASLHGANNLVDVYRFKRAVTLPHLHLRHRFGQWKVGIQLSKSRLYRRHGECPFPRADTAEETFEKTVCDHRTFPSEVCDFAP